MPSARPPPLSEVLPPLVLGTATFNHQYHPSPSLDLSLPILARALELGVSAVDTSPYYGPSELLLGAALRSLGRTQQQQHQQQKLSSSTTSTTLGSPFLITKAGRVGPSAFDYSPAHIRHSVRRSLRRLGARRLDLVHCHDAEFVSPAEVVAAVRELRRLRDEEGLLRYVGVSGYPLPVLASLAELVLAETGEPLDAVQSYSHFCIQNDALGDGPGKSKTGASADDQAGEEYEKGSPGHEQDQRQNGGGSGPGDAAKAQGNILARLQAAGVSVVTNASMLSMGLLTTRGVDEGPQASWHPAPPALRRACKQLAGLAERSGERLEDVALRWAMGTWAKRGASLGTSASSSSSPAREGPSFRVGVSVMGVTRPEELDETWRAWQDVLRELELERRSVATSSPEESQSQSQPQTQPLSRTPEEQAVVARADKIRRLVEHEMWPALGEWRNHSWESPQPGFVNQRRAFGVLPEDVDDVFGEEDAEEPERPEEAGGEEATPHLEPPSMEHVAAGGLQLPELKPSLDIGSAAA